MVDLGPITEDVFEAKKAAMVEADASAITDCMYKCVPCNKTFKSEA